MTGITGAVKNLGIGATPVRMYGNGPKVVASDQSGRWQMIPHWDFKGSVKPLDQWIHDYYLCRPADYVITDGIQGAQYGPFPGAGMGNSYLLPQVQMNMRLILAGSDALAVDAIHALITGNDPLLVGHLQLLALQGMGCIHPAFIQVKGTPVDRVKKRFKEVSPGNLSQYTDFEGSQAEIKWEARGQELTICSQEDWLYAEVHTSDTCIRINGAAASEPVTQKMPIAEPFELRLYDRFLNVTRWFSLSIQSGESER